MFRKLVGYLLSGTAVVLPVTLTFYIIFRLVIWADSLFKLQIPGLGLLIVLVSLTLLGFLANIFIGRPLFAVLDRLMLKIPLISFIYSALKDVVVAFTGKNDKFSNPVAVKVTSTGMLKLGFITQSDTENIIGHTSSKYVAVYFPHSYNFSGNLFLVPSENIRVLDKKPSSFMKYIVSGGIINEIIEELEE